MPLALRIEKKDIVADTPILYDFLSNIAVVVIILAHAYLKTLNLHVLVNRIFIASTCIKNQILSEQAAVVTMGRLTNRLFMRTWV